MRIVKGEQLNILLAVYFDRGKGTLEMQLPDGRSSDRHAWAAAAAAGQHGREVFRDDDNNVDINSNVWSAFKIWHSVRMRQVGNLLW